MDKLELTRAPVMRTGMLIRKPPADVFEAFVDPNITTKFWFTKGNWSPGGRQGRFSGPGRCTTFQRRVTAKVDCT